LDLVYRTPYGSCHCMMCSEFCVKADRLFVISIFTTFDEQ